ncbi:hypothetical protein CBS9595_001823 [Malassezia furfur]|nr:hypothetical protein CBS9595_001823 [Malassezia furfur]
MKVVVRIRGTAGEGANVLQTTGPRGSQVHVDADMPSSASHLPTLGTQQSSGRSKTYTFDHVFSAEADQGMVYQDVVSGVLDEVLLGYNCTVFAYGQTGTGKTHTMEGDLASYMGTFAPDAGIIPRTLFRLFHVLRARTDEFSVHMSFVELYNEELRDLLSAESPTPLQSSALRMYEDKQKGVVLQGLEEIPLTSAEHGLRLLRRGSQKRHIAATRCNESSSRSHCVFTLHVHVKETGARGEEVLRTGKLNLVDLAGSENIGRSGAENKRAREAGMINQSLLTLGRVINALVDGQTHIPYRESRLTRLLQDSLGGRTKTCIIATVSDDRANLEETLSTLDYASRAKSIKNRPELNQRMARAALIHEYVAEIDRLRADLTATREKSGVYVDADNWARLEAERGAQAKMIDELRRANEVAQSKLASMHEQLEQNTQLLTQRDAEWSAAETRHAARIAEVEASLQQVTQLSDALQEETRLHRARARNEQRLYDLAASLHRAANASSSDMDALHAKLERRAANEAEARASLALFYEQIEGVCAAAEREPAALHTGRDALQRAVHAELERLAQALDAAPSVPAHALDAVRRAFAQLESEHATLMDALQGELREAHARHVDAVHAAAILVQHVDRRVGALGERMNALQQHTYAAAHAEVQRATQHTERLATLLAQEREQTQELRRRVLGVVDAFDAERETRFAQASHAAQAELTATKRSVADARRVHIEHHKALVAEHEALAADAQWDAPALAAPDALLAPHVEAYAERLAAHADSLQDEVRTATAAAIDEAGDAVRFALASSAREIDTALACTAAADGARAEETQRSLDALRRSYGAFLQPTFLAEPASGSTPRRRPSLAFAAHIIPSDREAGLAP